METNKMATKLTVTETGKRINASPQTVIKFLKQGKLTGSKPGKKYLIDKKSVDELLKKSQVK